MRTADGRIAMSLVDVLYPDLPVRGRYRLKPFLRRQECRRGGQECPRHKNAGGKDRQRYIEV
jgi:hypothetical protein